mgnify:CR=1 FL=1
MASGGGGRGAGVGSRGGRALGRRFGIGGTDGLVAWSFDQLFGWHDWAWRERRLAPLGLIAPGSSPIAAEHQTTAASAINTPRDADWKKKRLPSPVCLMIAILSP